MPSRHSPSPVCPRDQSTPVLWDKLLISPPDSLPWDVFVTSTKKPAQLQRSAWQDCPVVGVPLKLPKTKLQSQKRLKPGESLPPAFGPCRGWHTTHIRQQQAHDPNCSRVSVKSKISAMWQEQFRVEAQVSGCPGEQHTPHKLLCKAASAVRNGTGARCDWFQSQRNALQMQALHYKSNLFGFKSPVT